MRRDCVPRVIVVATVCLVFRRAVAYESVSVRNLLNDAVVVHVVWVHPNDELREVETVQATALQPCETRHFGSLVAMASAAQDDAHSAWGNYKCALVCVHHTADPLRRCYEQDHDGAESTIVTQTDSTLRLNVHPLPNEVELAFASDDETAYADFDLKAPLSITEWTAATCEE